MEAKPYWTQDIDFIMTRCMQPEDMMYVENAEWLLVGVTNDKLDLGFQ